MQTNLPKKKVAILTSSKFLFDYFVNHMQTVNPNVMFFFVDSIHPARAVIFDKAIEYCPASWQKKLNNYHRELLDRFARYKTEVMRIEDQIKEPFIIFMPPSFGSFLEYSAANRVFKTMRSRYLSKMGLSEHDEPEFRELCARIIAYEKTHGIRE